MQKKNRKGFTLIELLDVIVILAIIALIAVPVIMNVITKARVSAFEDSAYGIVKAGELYYSNQLLEPEGMTEDKEFTVTDDGFQNEDGDKLEISGSLPSGGKVTVTSDGKVALVISNGEYCIQKATSESKVEAVKQENCSDYKRTANSVFTTSTENASIPACITNNTECDAGTSVAVKVNNTDDPIDFYVISENTSENEITLIMNKNLGGTVAWASKDDYVAAGGTESDYGEYGNNNKGPITALKELEKRTSNWTNIPLETYQVKDENNLYPAMTRTARARLITMADVNSLCNSSCPTWLYGNLGGSGQANGYWTSSAYAGYYSDYAYVLYYDGYADDSTHIKSTVVGIRPVITISKTNI